MSKVTYKGVPGTCERMRHHIDAWQKYRASDLVADLEEPGQVAAVAVPLRVPGRLDGSSGAVDGEVTLVVKLADPEAPDGGLRNTVAMFRGAGMVVKYEEMSKLSISARPFHALL